MPRIFWQDVENKLSHLGTDSALLASLSSLVYFLPIEKAIFWDMSDSQGRAAEFMNKSNFKKSSSVMNCVSYHCKVWCKFMCKWNIIIMFEIIDQWNWPNCEIKHQINNQWNQVLIKENCIPSWLRAFEWVLC